MYGENLQGYQRNIKEVATGHWPSRGPGVESFPSSQIQTSRNMKIKYGKSNLSQLSLLQDLAKLSKLKGKEKILRGAEEKKKHMWVPQVH